MNVTETKGIKTKGIETNIIETYQLTKSYKNKVVVDKVSLHVKRGEIYGFVGPNGAGKSTVMKMLLNLETPDGGEIRLFGKAVQTQDYELLKRIGSIIENPYFYENLTGTKNLELHCDYMGYHRKNEIPEILDVTDLTQAAQKKVSQYSLGMKQRLAIARAVLTRPELLVLDEPINALDPEGIRKMRKLFRSLNQKYGTTFFISSHILAEMEQIADTIGIISQGRLIKEISMAKIHEYQTDFIELEVDNIEKTALLLERMYGERSFRVVSGEKIELYRTEEDIRDLSLMLVRESVGILGIARKQNSLEDYFFQAVQEVEA